MLIAAIGLFTINLGELPLRDWDEGLVAQVAREISQSAWSDLTWVYPTMWGEPYLNKPPLVHDLIALTYSIAGVHEWTARLPGALLTACSVPLLYAIGREVFHQRSQALFASLVYLTCLPVVRNGRLAMLDGAVLCFALVMLLCVLRSRRNFCYALGAGLGLSLIALTKGAMVAVLLGAIALLFLLWDTPRLLTLPFFWLGIFLGCVPAYLWYGAQWFYYGQEFLSRNLVDQSFGRIWTDVEKNGGPPWFYLLEIIKYSAPWLLFLPSACRLTWTQRNLSWARLAIVWGGSYLVAVSLMATKLPWYVLPFYPAFALVVGAQISELWQRGRHVGIKDAPVPPYSRIWVGLFALLAIVCAIGALFYGVWTIPHEPDLQMALIAFGATMASVAVLMAQQDAQFTTVLVWGTYVTLVLLMLSNNWIWELAETYAVKPVAALVQANTPAGQSVYTSYPDRRPSLDFYSDRPVLPANPKRLQRLWNKPEIPYFLLDAAALSAPDLQPQMPLGTAEGWTLVRRR